MWDFSRFLLWTAVTPRLTCSCQDLHLLESGCSVVKCYPDDSAWPRLLTARRDLIPVGTYFGLRLGALLSSIYIVRLVTMYVN